jgi:hypothetical protein
MPLFEYDCGRCGELVEVLLRSGRPDPTQCGQDCVSEGPDAGTGALTRRRSVPGGYSMGRITTPSPAPTCGHCGETPEKPER